MKSNFVTAALLAGFLGATASHGATVALGGTGSTGTGGFTLIGGSGVIVDVTPNPAWNNAATTPASNWVWDSANSTSTELTFGYDFDLSGYDLATASLSGIWSVDNVGVAKLNGVQISELFFSSSSFAMQNAFSATSALFVAGVNTLTFEVEDLGLPGGFRTAFTVEADEISPVPLPAGLPMLLLGVAGLGLVRSRKS